MKKSVIKKVEDFEIKNKVISFITIILITIAVTRILTAIKDPNIIIKGFELHHFYYGIALLVITTILMLFGKKHYSTWLTLSSISIGLILDEFLYAGKGFGNYEIYSSTLPSAIIFVVIISIITSIVLYTSRRK